MLRDFLHGHNYSPVHIQNGVKLGSNMFAKRDWLDMNTQQQIYLQHVMPRWDFNKLANNFSKIQTRSQAILDPDVRKATLSIAYSAQAVASCLTKSLKSTGGLCGVPPPRQSKAVLAPTNNLQLLYPRRCDNHKVMQLQCAVLSALSQTTTIRFFTCGKLSKFANRQMPLVMSFALHCGLYRMYR